MPYLTVEDYIDRFTRAEAIRLTNESQTGVVEEEVVQRAINDATQYANAFVGGRYALPLPDPTPEILVGIIADLTRERLHQRRPSALVTTRADAARSLLSAISTGRAVLPIATGGTAPSQNDDSHAVRSGDGRTRIFTEASLADFTGFAGANGFRSGPLC